MSKTEDVAEQMVDSIINRVLESVKRDGRSMGIEVPETYLRAVELGVTAGISETIKMIEMMESIQRLDKLLGY